MSYYAEKLFMNCYFHDLNLCLEMLHSENEVLIRKIIIALHKIMENLTLETTI